MSGRLETTPWSRDAVAAYIPGGQAALVSSIPAGTALHLSAKSASGPYRVEVHNGRAVVYDRTVRAPEFAETVREALGVVWP